MKKRDRDLGYESVCIRLKDVQKLELFKKNPHYVNNGSVEFRKSFGKVDVFPDLKVPSEPPSIYQETKYFRNGLERIKAGFRHGKVLGPYFEIKVLRKIQVRAAFPSWNQSRVNKLIKLEWDGLPEEGKIIFKEITGLNNEAGKVLNKVLAEVSKLSKEEFDREHLAKAFAKADIQVDVNAVMPQSKADRAKQYSMLQKNRALELKEERDQALKLRKNTLGTASTKQFDWKSALRLDPSGQGSRAGKKILTRRSLKAAATSSPPFEPPKQRIRKSSLGSFSQQTATFKPICARPLKPNREVKYLLSLKTSGKKKKHESPNAPANQPRAQAWIPPLNMSPVKSFGRKKSMEISAQTEKVPRSETLLKSKSRMDKRSEKRGRTSSPYDDLPVKTRRQSVAEVVQASRAPQVPSLPKAKRVKGESPSSWISVSSKSSPGKLAQVPSTKLKKPSSLSGSKRAREQESVGAPSKGRKPKKSEAALPRYYFKNILEECERIKKLYQTKPDSPQKQSEKNEQRKRQADPKQAFIQLKSEASYSGQASSVPTNRQGPNQIPRLGVSNLQPEYKRFLLPPTKTVSLISLKKASSIKQQPSGSATQKKSPRKPKEKE